MVWACAHDELSFLMGKIYRAGSGPGSWRVESEQVRIASSADLEQLPPGLQQ